MTSHTGKRKVRTKLQIGLALVVLFVLPQAWAENNAPSKADVAKMQAAHLFATTLIAGAVPMGVTGNALITRFPANQTWVCRLSVSKPDGLPEEESRSDKSSPERACTQAFLALARRHVFD